MIKLNIGGGKGHPRVPGWTIVDLREGADVRLDITRDPLPYADDSVEVIFTSHTLEHIPRERLGFVLSEFRRVIKPGTGLVRILVPDIARAVKAYADKDAAFFRSSEVTTPDAAAPLGGQLIAWFYSISKVGHGHVHGFDEEYMTYWLRAAGFNAVGRTPFRGSAMPELRGEAFDRHPNDSLCMECRRPAMAEAAA